MILYGASGHGKVIAEILRANGITDIIFWDDSDDAVIWDLVVEKPDTTKLQGGKDLLVSIGVNKIRKMIAERLGPFTKFHTAIHPSSVLSPLANIGEGTAVMAAVVINADALIGQHCIVNTASVIEHDCEVADYVHVSPNATLCGNVIVGEGTHIGAGAVVIPGVKIGAWCTIGAGTVVIKDIPDGSTVVGCPGRVIKTIHHGK